MNKIKILQYYKKWTGGKFSNDGAISFTNMLLQKATFALSTGKTVFAYDRNYTGKELEAIYCKAEDLFTDHPEYRGY